MTRKWIAAIGGSLLLSTAMSAQRTQSPKIRVVFPQGHSERASISYRTRVADGRYLWHVGITMHAGASFFEIPAADRFEAAVWAPGCDAKVFEIDVDTSDIELHFDCDSLRSIPFIGRISPADIGASGRISVDYAGTCPWFFRKDGEGCGGPLFVDVATARIAPNGTFKMELPDFTADPAISETQLGRFFFSLSDGKTTEPIKPESSQYPWLTTASAYPREITFVRAR